jgi:outer membrane immunogenic protein
MKKIFLLSSLALGVATTSMAQSKTTQKASSNNGNMLLNVGVGFSNWGIPVYAGLEGYVHPDITVGGLVSYRSYNRGWSNYDYKTNIFNIAAVGNYHFDRVFNLNSNWNIYAGLNLGFNIVSYSEPAGAPKYNGTSASGLALGAQVGVRYYFSNKVGLNLEFGGGNVLSGGRIGLTFKL